MHGESEAVPVSRGLSVLKLLADSSVELPFAILDDSIRFNPNLQDRYYLPDETDALFLGRSTADPGFQWYSPEYIQLLNGAGSECIVLLSAAFGKGQGSL